MSLVRSQAEALRQEKGRLIMKGFSLWATLFLRISLGWLFLYAGISKIGVFTAKGYLLSLKGPFATLFYPLAGNFLVDQLVIWGLILIGICLITGTLVRFASFWGIVMMALFYLTVYPPEHALLVDEHVIYSFVLLFFIFSNPGHFYGVDKVLEKRLPKYKNLMG